jgi:Prokaryotic E2 family E
MTKRLAQEMAILKAVFPDAEFVDKDSGWIKIPRYTFQHGAWKQTEVSVCFQVPAGYPGDAPYAFWVTPLLRIAGIDAAPTNNYQEPSPTPFQGTWGRFSWSHESSWKPGAEPAAGSNFLNFALSFRDRFSEGV